MKDVTRKDEVYVCEIRGNKVQVIEAGVRTRVCCGQDMTLVKSVLRRCEFSSTPQRACVYAKKEGWRKNGNIDSSKL
jgi:desulfoferrodoxin-like iron-binding protein